MKQKTIFLISIIAIMLISCNSNINTKVEHSEDNYVNGLIQTQLGNTEQYISIPKDYIIEESNGADFDVYYFYHKDSTELIAFRGGVYIGGHPSEFTADEEICKSETLRSKILNNNAMWTIYKCGTNYSLQTITEHIYDDGWEMKIHAFGNCSNRNDVNNLLKVFSTLEIQ